MENVENASNQTFNVVMVGSRRAGKSSMLASMIDSFSSLPTSTINEITLTATPDTEEVLKHKKMHLENIYTDKNSKSLEWIIDTNPTDVSYEYEFKMSIKGSPNSYFIRFTDIPGEDFMLKEVEVKEILKRSQVIMIAIDTPHLVEENGEHSDAFNITEQINTLLSFMKQDIHRLILFVPIKCEKYYYEERMQEIVDAIEDQYGDLLTSFRTGKGKNIYTVAITPILSLGGVVFRDFQRKPNGDVDVIEIYDNQHPSLYLRPKAAYYQLYAPAPVFAPKYCEQPVLYLLNFVIKNARFVVKKAQKKGLLRRFADISIAIVGTFIALIFSGYPILIALWKNVLQDQIFIESTAKTFEQLKTSGDGYKILQDPLRLQNSN